MTGSGVSPASPAPDEKARRRSWALFAPLAVFAVLAAVFVFGLMRGDPGKLPSALLDKAAPRLELPPVEGAPTPGLRMFADDAQDHLEKPVLVNFWASWCAQCRAEHPVLMALAAGGEATVVGVNYKDAPAHARRFLNGLGNPYAALGADRRGRAGIEWGVVALPESFLVDRQGIIRYKWTGPLTPEALERDIAPRIRALNALQ